MANKKLNLVQRRPCDLCGKQHKNATERKNCHNRHYRLKKQKQLQNQFQEQSQQQSQLQFQDEQLSKFTTQTLQQCLQNFQQNQFNQDLTKSQYTCLSSTFFILRLLSSFFTLLNKHMDVVNQFIRQYQNIIYNHNLSMAFCMKINVATLLTKNNVEFKKQFKQKLQIMLENVILIFNKRGHRMTFFIKYCKNFEDMVQNGWMAELQSTCQQITQKSGHLQKQQWLCFEKKINEIHKKFISNRYGVGNSVKQFIYNIENYIKYLQERPVRLQLINVLQKSKMIDSSQERLFKIWQTIKQKTRNPLKILFENRKIMMEDKIFNKNILNKNKRFRKNESVQWSWLVNKLRYISTMFESYLLSHSRDQMIGIVDYFQAKITQIKSLQKEYNNDILGNVNELKLLLARLNQPSHEAIQSKQYEFFFHTIGMMKDKSLQLRSTLKDFRQLNSILLSIQKGLNITSKSSDLKEKVTRFIRYIEKAIQIFHNTEETVRDFFQLVKARNQQSLTKIMKNISLQKMDEHINRQVKFNRYAQVFNDLMYHSQISQISEDEISRQSQYRCRLRKPEAVVQQRQLQFYPQTKICKHLKLILRTNKYAWVLLPQNIIDEVIYGTYGSKKNKIIIDDKLSNQQLIDLIKEDQKQKHFKKTAKKVKVRKLYKNIEKQDKNIEKQDVTYQKNLKISQSLGIKSQFMRLYSYNFDRISLDKFLEIYQQAKIQKMIENWGIRVKNNKSSASCYLKNIKQNQQVKPIKQVQQFWWDWDSIQRNKQIEQKRIGQIKSQHLIKCQQYWRQRKQIPEEKRPGVTNEIFKTSALKIDQIRRNYRQKQLQYLIRLTKQYMQNEKNEQIYQKMHRKVPQSLTYYRQLKQKFNNNFQKDKMTFTYLKKIQSKCINQRIVANDRLSYCQPIQCGPDNIEQFIIHGSKFQKAKMQFDMHLNKIRQKLKGKQSLSQILKDCRPWTGKLDTFDSNKQQDELNHIEQQDELNQIEQQDESNYMKQLNHYKQQKNTILSKVNSYGKMKRYKIVQQEDFLSQIQFYNVPVNYRRQIQMKLRQLKFQTYRQFVNFINKRRQQFLKLKKGDFQLIKQLMYKDQYNYHLRNTAQYISLSQFIQQEQIEETKERIHIKTFISLMKFLPSMYKQHRDMAYYISLLLDQDFQRINNQLKPFQGIVKQESQKLMSQLLNKRKRQQIRQEDADVFKKDMNQLSWEQLFCKKQQKVVDRNKCFVKVVDIKEPMINTILNFDQQKQNDSHPINEQQMQQQKNINQICEYNENHFIEERERKDDVVQDQVQKSINEIPQQQQNEINDVVVHLEQAQQSINGVPQKIECQHHKQQKQQNHIEIIDDTPQSIYFPQLNKKVLMKYSLKQKNQTFIRPNQSTKQQRILFHQQIKTFFYNKKIDNYRFEIRRNITDEAKFKFDPNVDKRKFTRLRDQQLKLLDQYQTQKLTFPLKYVFVNDRIGGGFQASRDIQQNQVVSFFNGKILTLQQGQKRKNGHNMMDYIKVKINGLTTWTVVTTCDQVWGLGPMFNHASQGKENLRIKGHITPYGVQYIMSAKRDIKKGEHLTWDYSSGESSCYQMKDLAGNKSDQCDINLIVEQNKKKISRISDSVIRLWKVAEHYPFEKIKQLQLRQFLRLKQDKLGFTEIKQIMNIINSKRNNQNTIFVQNIGEIRRIGIESKTFLLPIFFQKNHWMFLKIVNQDCIKVQINDSIIKSIDVYQRQLKNVFQYVGYLCETLQKSFIKIINTDFPQQRNEIDCGVFMIAGMRKVLQNVEFTGKNISKVRKQLANLLIQD